MFLINEVFLSLSLIHQMYHIRKIRDVINMIYTTKVTVAAVTATAVWDRMAE